MPGWIVIFYFIIGEVKSKKTEQNIELLKDIWMETGKTYGYEDGYKK